jgi:hypothetical protein
MASRGRGLFGRTSRQLAFCGEYDGAEPACRTGSFSVAQQDFRINYLRADTNIAALSLAMNIRNTFTTTGVIGWLARIKYLPLSRSGGREPKGRPHGALG